jgi:N-acetylglucosamine kinase-like BadF-type ATPase
MKEVFDKFLPKHNLTPSDIVASCFGLAGDDHPYQHKILCEKIELLGFKNYKIVNDSALGIKVGTKKGYGVCSINGTGTVNIGVDNYNNSFQIGGIGYVAGDEAGGSFLARAAVRATYDNCFRFGKDTKLKEDVFSMYEVDDYLDLRDVIIMKRVDSKFLVQSLFRRANEGDEVAIEILETAGWNMGKSIAGVIKELNFIEPINVILAGSIWAKATNDNMFNKFKETVYELTHKQCEFIILKEPPVLGAILWALELANNEVPNKELKEKINNSIIEYQNQFN